MAKLCAVLVFAAVLCGVATGGDIKLPEPQKTGGTPLFESMDNRSSAGQSTFPMGEISEQDLSTILWAASGLNRNGTKWTVPMAMGKPPYCKIYVVSDRGVYLYDWKDHILREITTENVKTDIPTQQFAQKAPVSLYIAVHAEQANSLNELLREEGGILLAGAMSQNIYLACESLDVGTRMVYSIKRDAASRLLKLDEGDVVLFGLPMGKK